MRLSCKPCWNLNTVHLERTNERTNAERNYYLLYGTVRPHALRILSPHYCPTSTTVVRTHSEYVQFYGTSDVMFSFISKTRNNFKVRRHMSLQLLVGSTVGSLLRRIVLALSNNRKAITLFGYSAILISTYILEYRHRYVRTETLDPPFTVRVLLEYDCSILFAVAS